MRIASGTTDQYVYFVAVDSTDFTTRETALSSFTVYRSRNGAAAAAMTTPTINETDVTNMPGVYELLLDEDTTIAAGNSTEEIVFHITHAGMAPVTRTIELYRPTVTEGNTLGVAADGDISGNLDGTVATVTTLTGHTAQTADHTAGIADIPTVAEFNARTLVAASYFDPAADTVANVTTVATLTGHTAQTADHTANIASILTDTGEIGTAGAGLTALTRAIATGQAQAGTSTTIQLAGATPYANDELNGTTITLTSGTGVGQSRTIDDYVGATDTATVSPAWATTPDATTNYEITPGTSESAVNAATIAAAVWNKVQADHTTAGSFGEVATEVASILADTNELQTDDVPGLIATAQADLDTITGADGVNLLSATQASIDAIETDTGTTLENHLTDIKGATFSGATDSLEAVRDRGDAAWTTGAGGSDRLLMVDTTIATLSSQTSFTLTAGSTDNDAYNNCTIVIEDVSTSTQKAVGLISDYVGATKTVTLKYDPGIFTMAATDKVYILAENSLKTSTANQQIDVTSGAVDTVTTLTGHTAQTGDSFARLAAPAGASVSADIAAVKAETALIVADTNELQTDDVPGLIAALNDPTAASVADAVWDEAKAGHVGAGSFGEEVQAHALTTDVTTAHSTTDALIGTPAADVSADIAAVKAETALIVADTNELQTDDVPGLIAALDVVVDRVEADTQDIQSRIPAALVGGRIDCTVDGTGMETGAIDAILQRQITESYNTDGTAPTVEQALCGVLQALTEFSISGTTLTVKKLDGTTTAMTFTLDDASDPTSRTRAT